MHNFPTESDYWVSATSSRSHAHHICDDATSSFKGRHHITPRKRVYIHVSGDATFKQSTFRPLSRNDAKCSTRGLQTKNVSKRRFNSQRFTWTRGGGGERCLTAIRWSVSLTVRLIEFYLSSTHSRVTGPHPLLHYSRRNKLRSSCYLSNWHDQFVLFALPSLLFFPEIKVRKSSLGGIHFFSCHKNVFCLFY